MANASNACVDKHHPGTLPLGYILIKMPMALVLVAESVITLYICRKNLKILDKPSAEMLTSLAITGGLIGLSIICFTAVVLLKETDDLVRLLMCIPRMLHIVSVLMLCCLSLDRYLALCWPLRYHDLLTPSRCRLLVVGCWVLVAVIFFIPGTSIRFLSDCPNVVPLMVTYAVVFFVAVLFMVALYCLMAWEFWQNRHVVKGANKAMQRENYRVRQKTATDVITVVSLNLLLSFPDIVVRLMSLQGTLTYQETKYITPCLLLLHQLVFLPLYVWRNADFREALLRLWASFRASCSSNRPAASSCSSSISQHSASASKNSITTVNTVITDPPVNTNSPQNCPSTSR